MFSKLNIEFFKLFPLLLKIDFFLIGLKDIQLYIQVQYNLIRLTFFLQFFV